jgi:predicted RNA-binding Zn ribbon-like protein
MDATNASRPTREALERAYTIKVILLVQILYPSPMRRVEGAPAPGALRLVQEFVNTADHERGTERLDGVVALQSWLAGRVLVPPRIPVSAGQLRSAIALREALRELLAAHADAAAHSRATATVNAAGRRARLAPRLDEHGRSLLEPEAAAFDAALGRIVAAVHAGVADGTWERLKACARPTCRWAFYDHSKNQSGKWCAMAGSCGGREKSRRAYARRVAGS